MKVKIEGYIVANDEKEVYDYYGITSTCPADINSAIEQANGKPLDVEIATCYGGEIDAGSEIYTALRAYSGGIHIAITSLAASAASIIAMAGPSEMSPTARMMVHKVSGGARGNSDMMDQASNMLQQADKSLALAYQAKSGMTEEEALKMMKDETWLTAKQAVDLNLVDKVMFTDDEPLTASFVGGMLPKEVIEKTRNILHPSNPITTSDTAEIAKAKLALQLTL